MSANLENSAVATGLEKVSFHSNPKERQCQVTPAESFTFAIESNLILAVLSHYIFRILLVRNKLQFLFILKDMAIKGPLGILPAMGIICNSRGI